MQLQELWLVLAGFVLGFAVSTLWEWLYYRRYRWQPYRQAVFAVGRDNEPEISAFETETLAVPLPEERFSPEYRSPGVFLESEQKELSATYEEPRPTVAAPVSGQVVA